jgi:hypothetical protein
LHEHLHYFDRNKILPLPTVSLAREAVNRAGFLEISCIAAFLNYSLVSVCGVLGHGSMIPALVSGRYFWCLVLMER